MELKKLFTETFTDYYNVNKKKETYVHLSTVKKVLKETTDRIEKSRIESITNEDIDIAIGLEMAKKEMCFIALDIMQEQLKK